MKLSDLNIDLDTLTQIPFETVASTKFAVVGDKVFLLDPASSKVHQITSPGDANYITESKLFTNETGATLELKGCNVTTEIELKADDFSTKEFIRADIKGVPSSKEFKKLQKDNAKLASRLKLIEDVLDIKECQEPRYGKKYYTRLGEIEINGSELIAKKEGYLK